MKPKLDIFLKKAKLETKIYKAISEAKSLFQKERLIERLIRLNS